MDATTPVSEAPRKRGRPRKSTPAQRDLVILLRFERGLSREAIAQQTGLGDHVVQLIIKEEIGRRKAASTPAPAPIADPAAFKRTTKERFDGALREYKRRIDLTFEQRVATEVKRRTDQAFPLLQQAEEAARVTERSYRELIGQVKTTLTSEQWGRLMKCVHTDTAAYVSKELRDEMAQLLNEKRFGLTGEKK